MDIPVSLVSICIVVPGALMVAAALVGCLGRSPTTVVWQSFQVLSSVALVAALISVLLGPGNTLVPGVLLATPLGLIVALLVQLLGTVIGGFSARYLQGEVGQRRYVAALAAVLASVHLLLLADHWLVLIAAWTFVGIALQHLLCFYPDRVFARLAAHKKRIADRVADGLLLTAAALAWIEVGSGSLSALWAHLDSSAISPSLQWSAVLLVLAVVVRTALLPVHGWLIQVMEAPTPVSALLHAGVVNLGGFVLIRFAPLLEQADLARTLLLGFGLVTAVLAGMVMLTRISIKVRLAWSTVAQMGFMLLECALGLYTLAALHLIGHSLYKAHAFLSASSVVRHTRLQALHGPQKPGVLSLAVAPAVTISIVLLVLNLNGHATWPWWWSAILGLAWAPILWIPAAGSTPRESAIQVLSGLLMVGGLTAISVYAHAIPMGIADAPHHLLGQIALVGMLMLYVGLAVLQVKPHRLSRWRRWSYAGFYVDEAYTRLALRLWPAWWTPANAPRPTRN